MLNEFLFTIFQCQIGVHNRHANVKQVKEGEDGRAAWKGNETAENAARRVPKK